MSIQIFIMLASGILVGIGAAFTGLGGGFLLVPLLLFLGYTAQKAVGTSFLAILVISISALIAHNKFANVDYKTGFLLGIGVSLVHRLGPDWLNMFLLHILKRYSLLFLSVSQHTSLLKNRLKKKTGTIDLTISYPYQNYITTRQLFSKSNLYQSFTFSLHPFHGFIFLI